MTGSEQPERVIVTLDDACASDASLFDSVAERCAAAGLRIGKRLRVSGILTGVLVPPSVKSAIAALPHVVKVERDEKRHPSKASGTGR